MIDQDYPHFVELWTAANQLMAGGKALSNTAMGMVFNALRNYPLQIIEQAINKHIQTAQFAPTPADIINLLKTGNKHLSPAEAWAIVPKTVFESGVITNEILRAWCIASELYEKKQVFAAEKAFLAAYARIVSESELVGKPVEWTLTKGSNHDMLKTVVEDAVRLGRLKPDYANRVLESLPKPMMVEGLALIGRDEKVKKDDAWKQKLADAKKIVADSLKAEIEKHNAEKLAAEQARRDREDAAIALLSPDQKRAFEQANFERYREFNQDTLH